VVIVAVMIVAVMIPVALLTPLMGAAVPPPMILIPAMVSLGVKVASTLRGLSASLAMLPNRVIQSRFGLFDPMLTFSPIVIRMNERDGAEHQHRCNRHHGGCGFAQLHAVSQYVQRILLRTSRL
jgi:hypothetical protein